MNQAIYVHAYIYVHCMEMNKAFIQMLFQILVPVLEVGEAAVDWAGQGPVAVVGGRLWRVGQRPEPKQGITSIEKKGQVP